MIEHHNSVYVRAKPENHAVRGINHPEKGSTAGGGEHTFKAP